MKIRGHGPLEGPQGIADRTAEKTRPVRPETPGLPPDRLEVSSAAREFAAIRDAALRAPEVRAELVETLRQKIDSGAYEPQARAIATRMLEELGAGLGE